MSLLPFTNYEIRPYDELPKHITFEEYNQLLSVVANWYDAKKYTEKREFRKERNLLFLRLLWESGGRITDVLNIKVSDINFMNKKLTLYIEKRNKYHTISLFESLIMEIKVYIQKYKIKKLLFDKTRQWGWWLVKKFGKLINLDLNPHMFRHGLALYLLSKRVDIRVISYRLAHSSPLTTIKYYLKVTPEIERMILTSAEAFS